MASTEIAEPSDLTPSAITPETESRFRILVYQQAEEDAGIKTLGIADWKNYLGFNSAKVDNVATYVGIDTDEYDYTSTTPLPLPSNVTSIVNRIKALSDNTGVPAEPTTPYTPLTDRIGLLEDEVVNGYEDTSVTPPVNRDGLLTRVLNTESEIEDIHSEIGTGTTPGNTLTSRINSLETKVGDASTGPGTGSGLMLLTEEHTEQIIHISEYLGEPEQGVPSSGITERIENLESKVGEQGSTPGTSTGIYSTLETQQGEIDTINDTLGDANTTGTVLGDIAQLNKFVGTSTYDYDNKGSVEHRLADLEQTVSSAYVFAGSITDVINGTGGQTNQIVVNNENLNIPADMKNGLVFNINPPSGITSFTINGVVYYKDENIAWVGDNTDGHFDKLSTGIDVTKIDELDTRVGELSDGLGITNTKVTNLQNKWTSTFKVTSTGGDVIWWRSNEQITEAGIYLITACKQNTLTGDKIFNAVIGDFSDDGRSYGLRYSYLTSDTSALEYDSGAFKVNNAMVTVLKLS